MKVAILGGGLSAAFAWRACLDSGITPEVYADRLFVPPGGFVYVHWLPKSVRKQGASELIDLVPNGTALGYTSKMWGTTKKIPSSFPSEKTYQKGFHPLLAARSLWGGRGVITPHLHLGTLQIDAVAGLVQANDVVIQTFAPGSIPLEYHTPIWVVPSKSAQNFVIYDGTFDNFWTRKSQLFNFCSYEFPPVKIHDTSYIAQRAGEYAELDKIPGAKLWYAPEIPPPEVAAKPQIEYYCDGKTLYVGRWATGRRKFLSHETYERVRNFLKERQG